MTLGIAGLIIAYVMVVLLLLSINLYSNWSWYVKAGTIVVATCLFIVTYISIPPLLGWPTSQLPPERFRLLAGHVQHPDKATGRPGAIYLWVAGLENLAVPGKPRSFALPYSEALHQQVISAQAKMHKGMPQLGELQELDGSMKVEVEDTSKAGVESIPLQFYDLPDPLAIEK